MIKLKVARFDHNRQQYLIHVNKVSGWVTPAQLDKLQAALVSPKNA